MTTASTSRHRGLAPAVLAASAFAVLTACGAPKALRQEPPPPPPPPAQSQTAAPNPGSDPNPVADDVPALPAPVATNQPLERAISNQHANGLLSVAAPGNDPRRAVVQMLVRAGHDAGAPGVAELAAEVLVAASDAGSGRRSLRQRAGELGGQLDVQVAATGTWLTLQVPASRWQDAAEALLAAARDATGSRTQIERIREEYVVRRSREVWADPSGSNALALLHGLPGTNASVANLLDRDASEVRQFLAAQAVPARTVLTVETAAEPSALRSALDAVVADARWRPAAANVPERAPTASAPATGIHWAPAPLPGLITASFVVPLPDDGDPAQGDAAVLLACLTLDGVGGRFEQLLRDRNLGDLQFRSQWLTTGSTPALVLTTRASPLGAVLAWRAFGEARESLRTAPPSASELALATRRATLTARLLRADAAARLRNRVGAVLRGEQDGDPTLRRLQQLTDRGGRGATAGLDAFLARPGALLVFGGEPPADVALAAKFELLPAGALAKLAGAPEQVQAGSGRPWLQPSLEVLGGSELLRRTDGFRATVVRSVAGAAAASEQVDWRAPDQLTRTRRLLGQELVTEIRGKDAKERTGAETRSLDSVESRRTLREYARHPVALLAAHARGELEFRPVARRDSDGREVLILEAVGGDFERLRIHVEATSRLIRTVESWETLETGVRGYLQETWSDYRQVGGVRFPHHVERELDDGAGRVTIDYADVEPSLQRR